MERLDPTQITARQLLSVAQQLGINFTPLWRDWIFRNENRTIYFWEEGGNYCYTLQGVISKTPNIEPRYTSDADMAWSESGTVEGVATAIQLITAWLVERQEVNALPNRHIISHGRS